MKLAVLLAILLVVPPMIVDAAEVTKARLNLDTRSIEADIRYVGGCFEHTFALEISSCLEVYPVACRAILKDTSGEVDSCDRVIERMVSFSLSDLGLEDPYYRGANIMIEGDNYSGEYITLP